MKLNLGSGDDYKEGYVNIDNNKKYCNNGLDLECDVRKLPYENNTVDEILAEGIIEHISYRDVIPMLCHWFDILKPNAKLYIETPNLERILIEVLRNSGNIMTHEYETLYGGQRDPSEFHVALYTEKMLESMLMIAGFKEVARIKQLKNLNSGDDWSIRMVGTKLYENPVVR